MTDKVSNYLRKFRMKQNLTQEELARQTQVTRQTIIAIEKGNYTPSVSLALKLADKLNITVEQLFKVSDT